MYNVLRAPSSPHPLAISCDARLWKLLPWVYVKCLFSEMCSDFFPINMLAIGNNAAREVNAFQDFNQGVNEACQGPLLRFSC